ncbi:MAG: IS256 family transposase [Minisyncoccia bacterium]
MKNKISTLPYGYQTKIRKINSPEEILAMAKELSALQEKPEISEETIMVESFPSEPKQTSLIPTNSQPDLPEEANSRSPWYDLVGNETEAMIIDLYAKGLTTRDISNFLKRANKMEISQPAISAITDKVFPLVKEWQARPLSSCYPILYLDGMHFKVREAGKISSKVAYIALGINLYGHREILGIWISETEGAKFWMHVLNELKNRGVDDILIACVDGLKGFPDAIKTIFPRTEVQVCVVHQIRHTLMFISNKDRKKFADYLKAVYTAATEDAGLQALKEMEKQWPQYISYLQSWENRWSDISPFFGYPQVVKRMIYTTNTIENLNRQFRKVTKTTQVFPHDDALVKLLWLAQADISERWEKSCFNWGEIMAQLTLMFPDRIKF